MTTRRGRCNDRHIRPAPTNEVTGAWDAGCNKESIHVTVQARSQEHDARLVRNLLALRAVLAVDQMQTGRWRERIEEIDEELAGLGHDMKSTAACAAEGLRRSFLLPRLVSRRARAKHPASRAAAARRA